MVSSQTSAVIASIAAIAALIAAGAALAALFVQFRIATETNDTQVNIGARNSRATVVSANRQRWIDALRDDIAEFMAIRSQLAGLKNAGSFERSGQDALLTEERELRSKLQMLRVRIELRINRNEAEHIDLLDAIDQYDREFSSESDTALKIRASSIFKAEWERLKKEASGINPFVKG